MINVSLSFDTVSEAAKFFAAHLPNAAPVAAALPTEEQRVEKIHAAEVKADPKPAKVAKPAATQPTAEATPVDVPEPKAEPVAEVVKAEPKPVAKSTIDYPTLQKAVFKLASISREACTEVAQQFGRTTFKDSPADIWDKALAAVNAKIEELAKQPEEVA